LLESAVLDEAEARTLRAMQAITAYIARHPLAADSEQGIAQWWLPAMGVDVPPASVHAALDRLVMQQVLARSMVADGSAIYRAAAAVPQDNKGDTAAGH
jgi:hypothetical protein